MNDSSEKEILVESTFGASTRQPYVTFRWAGRTFQLSPTEARAHALLILEGGEAAEQDAFIVHFITKTVGASIENAIQLLSEFRSQRGQFGDSEPKV